MTIVAYVLIAAGAGLVLLNYRVLLANRRNRRLGIDRHQSFVPFLGGLLGAAGLYLLSGSALAGLGALLDPGVSVVLLLPVALLRRKRAERP